MKKSALQHTSLMLTVTLLVLAASPGFAVTREKRKQLNENYRKIAEQMEELYTGGKLHQVIGLYNEKCCKPGSVTGKWKPGKEKKEFKKVKKEIRADIYRSLALSLMALHRPEPGEIYIRKILVLRRDEGTARYWLSIRETARNKYYVAPRLLVGLKLGTNFTMADPGHRYKVLEPAAETGNDKYQKDYDFSFTHSRGSQAGVIIEYALSKNLSVTIQPTVTSLKFQYKNRFTREELMGSGEIEITTLNYTHRQKLSYLEIPLLLRYRLIKSKVKPYFQAGAYYGILQSGTKTLDAFSELDGSRNEEYEAQAIVDIKKMFTGSNFGIWIGAGIGFDSEKGMRLQIEVNYKHGFNNIIDEARRFENKELMFAYYDVFDDMKLRNWDISLKVLLPISFKAFRR